MLTNLSYCENKKVYIHIYKLFTYIYMHVYIYICIYVLVCVQGYKYL